MTDLTDDYSRLNDPILVKELLDTFDEKMRGHKIPTDDVLSGFLSLVMCYGVTAENLASDLAMPGIDASDIYLLEGQIIPFPSKIHKGVCMEIMLMLLRERSEKYPKF